jgi:hypothetical protein
MQNKFSFLVVCVMLISCSNTKHSGSSASLPGNWQATSIVIDGDNKDWPSPYPNYDAQSLVAYATSNDARNLYITMETGDEMTQVKILKRGLTVSIDTTGKKSPQFDINYPLANENEPLDMVRNDGQKTSLAKKQSEQKLNSLVQGANQFSLEGFPECSGGFMVHQVLPCGIKVKARIDEYKELVWEAVIPFKLIYGRDSLSASDAGKPISVCFVVNGFKAASTKSAGDNNGSMTNAPGMAGNNSRMRNTGTASPNKNDPNQHLYNRTKTWKQFGLAYQR